MLELPFAEVMASYACNLSCTGCTNYSNYQYKGYPDWEPIKEQIRDWLRVLRFRSFGIIGGEPLLNPHLQEWLYGIRALMPDTELLLVTNGTRLQSVPALLDWLVTCAPIKLTVAAHRDFDGIRRQFLEMVQASPHAFISETLNYIDRDLADMSQLNFVLTGSPVKLELYRPRIFLKSYQGFGTAMRPWEHNDPKAAIEICACRQCPLLYEGRLYKCSPAALLRAHLGRLGILDVPEWQPYIQYRGIAPTDPAKEIERFVRLFGQPEKICAMCPSEKAEDAWIDHATNVLTKREWQLRHGTEWPPQA